MSLRPIVGRTVRYTLVGIISAVLNNIAIILGDWFGVHYVVMSIACFVVVTPLAYLMHVGFTFREHGSWRGLLRFAGGLATAFPIFLLSMTILCTVLRLPVVVATPLATILVYIWNYILAHWAIRGDWRLR